jgi:hypothetical protein
MSRTKIACIKYIQKHCPQVTSDDLPKPTKHQYNRKDNYYDWTCPCGITLRSDVQTEANKDDVWREIRLHINRHDRRIWEIQKYLVAEINELKNQLSPATLNEHEPRIHKLIANYDSLSKWRRMCSEYPNIDE